MICLIGLVFSVFVDFGRSVGSAGPDLAAAVSVSSDERSPMAGGDGDRNDLEEVAEDDQRIVEVYQLLQAGEAKRTSFCREYEDENNIYFDFLIKAPTKEEAREILQVAGSARGRTQDWFTQQPIAWNAKLQEEFLFTGDCAHYQVSISYSKKTRRGDLSVMGIKEGDLKLIPGELPESSSGKYQVVFLGRPFEFDGNWRFKHLLEMDE
jgi:hypothetical protein